MKSFELKVGGMIFGALLSLPLAAHAQSDTVAHVAVGSTQASLSEASVTGMLKLLPPAARMQLAADPKRLDELVRSRLAVEAVLAEAHSKGWEKQSNVQAQIEAARRDVIARSYLASVSAPPAGYPSDADVQAAYDQHQAAFATPRELRIAQIYVAVQPGADAATVDKARKRADDLARRAGGRGADFSALAQSNSDDKTSAAKGGDMGFVPDPLLLPEIRKAADGLKPNEVAGPIQTGAGFHVIKLLDTHAPGTAPFSAVKDRIAAELREQREQQNARAYLAKLVAPDSVTIDEKALKAALSAVQ